MIAVHHGDCREIIPTLGVTVDAVVTDPPYHLQNIAERAARPFKARDGLQQNGAMSRLAAGFMGQQWDGGDIAFRPETWAAIATALRPGGFLIAFGGTRTHHRLACAIEDAGFVIQDTLMWLFATGFPKRRDMLKPAFEPLVLAYKPGGKRTMQVDECRISAGDEIKPRGSSKLDTNMHEGWARPWMEDRADVQRRHDDAIDRANNLGRWPANICHDGSDEVVAMFPDVGGSQIVRELRRNPKPDRDDGYGIDKGGDPPRGLSYADGATGSAARFFFSAKAGAQDRWGSRHPTVKPVELMKWLVALVTSPGGTVLDPFAGSGTTAVAALASGRNAILIEREDAYIADIRERLAFYEGTGLHSLQAKNRNYRGRPIADYGPLFEPRPLSPEEDAADSLASYNAAVMAIGERVKAGAPVPNFMLSRKEMP
jgi:site-specific DNA-methyltransferase (adenine-specific)